jgi:hypothetical protein
MLFEPAKDFQQCLTRHAGGMAGSGLIKVSLWMTDFELETQEVCVQ